MVCACTKTMGKGKKLAQLRNARSGKMITGGQKEEKKSGKFATGLGSSG